MQIRGEERKKQIRQTKDNETKRMKGRKRQRKERMNVNTK
jgi:hypothetical protein